MATRERDGLAPVVHEVADHARALARLELELALIELRGKAASLGAAATVLAGAVVLFLFALGFGLATAAAGLATFVPTWLALLLVTVSLLVTAIVAILIGRVLVRRATPPVPEQALAEARATGQVLRGGRGA